MKPILAIDFESTFFSIGGRLSVVVDETEVEKDGGVETSASFVSKATTSLRPFLGGEATPLSPTFELGDR